MKRFLIQNIDRTFWTQFLILVAIAILTLISASSTLVYAKGVFDAVGLQLTLMFTGVVFAYAMQIVPSYWIRFIGYLALGASILMLYALLIPGMPLAVTLNGATRWIKVGPLTIQPSEFAKISLIIVVADLLSRAKTAETKKKYFWWTLGITGVTVFPVLTSNLSTALLICGIVFLMWVLANIPWKYTLSAAGIAVLFMVAGYCIVEFGYVRTDRELPSLMGRAETWVNRIDRYIIDDKDAIKTSKFELTDANIQEVYANVAIARGGASPLGVLPGNSKERDYLPLAFGDYIFAIFVEETGIIGAVILIVIYLTILFRACYVSTRFADTASMLMMMGLALMLTCQALISMLVAVGIMPVTGQPLPMISRGGTSTLLTSLYFGIMMCVSREQQMLHDRYAQTIHNSNDDIPEISL